MKILRVVAVIALAGAATALSSLPSSAVTPVIRSSPTGAVLKADPRVTSELLKSLRGSPSFAGYYSAADGHLVIKMTGSPMGAHTFNLPANTTLDYGARYSQVDLLRLQADITMNPESFLSDAKSLVSSTVDDRTGKLVLTFNVKTPPKTPRLADSIAQGEIAISAPDTSPLPKRYGRTNDTAPFGGGIPLSSGGYDCSGGMTLKSTIHPYHWIATAGHCYNVGAKPTTHGVAVGNVSYRAFANGGNDFELIDTATTGASPYIWRNASTVERQYSEYGNSAGSQICFDGARTGFEVCGGVINKRNTCQNFDNGNGTVSTTCGLDQASKANTILCQEGDSGGPTYIVDNGYGLVVGGAIVGGNYTAVSTSGSCWYQDIAIMESATNSTLVK